MSNLKYYRESGCYQVNFGFLKMPPGYLVFKNEDGYCFWATDNDESTQSCNRFDALRGAWADFRGEK